MLRNIAGVTLLSVGDREDMGAYVVNGRIGKEGSKLKGVEANLYWMKWVIRTAD